MSYRVYYDRYKELKDTYRIRRGIDGLIPDEQLRTMSSIETESALVGIITTEYDVVVRRCGSVYAGAKYEVIYNRPKLSAMDLAVICDEGNLCFGYRAEGNYIIVYTD